jgi:hypothetical protein
MGGQLTIGPSAVIGGTVRFRGPRNADVAPGAQVAGGVENLRRDFRIADRRQVRTALAAAAIAWVVGWALVGVLILGVAPTATRTLTGTLRARPLASVLLGLAVLLGTPIAVVMLLVSIIGIPLALLALLGYLLILPLGYLASVTAVADSLLALLRRPGGPGTGLRILAFLVMLVVFFFAARLPFVGGLLVLLMILLGTGAIVLAPATRRSSGPRAAAA